MKWAILLLNTNHQTDNPLCLHLLRITKSTRVFAFKVDGNKTLLIICFHHNYLVVQHQCCKSRVYIYIPNFAIIWAIKLWIQKLLYTGNSLSLHIKIFWSDYASIFYLQGNIFTLQKWNPLVLATNFVCVKF